MLSLLCIVTVLVVGCTTPEVNSFEDCVSEGNPVLESYPRQCNTPDGKHFVETLQKNCSYDNADMKYVSKDPEECKTVNVLCIQGMESFSNACGCGCRIYHESSGKVQAFECTPEQKTNIACTKEYMPVCGFDEKGDSDTYGNACVACTKSEVTSYVKGECKPPKEEQKTFCTPDQRNTGVCTIEYHPVCGWFTDNIQCIKYPCASTASNPCQACQADNIAYWTEGECPE